MTYYLFLNSAYGLLVSKMNSVSHNRNFFTYIFMHLTHYRSATILLSVYYFISLYRLYEKSNKYCINKTPIFCIKLVIINFICIISMSESVLKTSFDSFKDILKIITLN